MYFVRFYVAGVPDPDHLGFLSSVLMNLLLWLLSTLGATSTLDALLASAGDVDGHETFSEKLEIRPTPDGKIVTTFTFTMTTPLLSEHYTLFPMPLGQILRWTNIREMHLSLNSGNWDYNRWGYESDVGTGGELWTWVEGDVSRCVVVIFFIHRWL